MNPATPNIPVHGDGSTIDDLFEINNAALCARACVRGKCVIITSNMKYEHLYKSIRRSGREPALREAVLFFFSFLGP